MLIEHTTHQPLCAVELPCTCVTTNLLQDCILNRLVCDTVFPVANIASTPLSTSRICWGE